MRALGWGGVRTYVQSGNVVFEADAPAGELEAALERAVAARFGFERPVIVRSAAQWRGYAAGSPFPEQEREAPNRLLLGVAKAPIARARPSCCRRGVRPGSRCG